MDLSIDTLWSYSAAEVLGLTIKIKKTYKFVFFLFYNCTFITFNFIRPVLEKYSIVLFSILYSNRILLKYCYSTLLYSTLLYSTLLYSTLLYSSNHFHLTTLLYSSSEILVLYPTLVLGQNVMAYFALASNVFDFKIPQFAKL